MKHLSCICVIEIHVGDETEPPPTESNEFIQIENVVPAEVQSDQQLCLPSTSLINEHNIIMLVEEVPSYEITTTDDAVNIEEVLPVGSVESEEREDQQDPAYVVPSESDEESSNATGKNESYFVY